MIKQYDDETHELRRKGHPREYRDTVDAEGFPVLNFHMPHLRMRASEWARTKKAFSLFRSQLRRLYGDELFSDSSLYRAVLLPLLEHAARELKIDGANKAVIRRLMLPLPRAEWLKGGKRKVDKAG